MFLLPSVVLAGQRGAVDLSVVTFAEENNGSGELEGLFNFNYKIDYKFKHKKWKLSFETDFFAATYPDYAFSVPEARFFYKTRETELSIGRKKIQDINHLDEDWILGVQTSFFRMNPFAPIRQGLTGLNYEIKTDQVYVDLFASPLFIPDQNSSLDVDGAGNALSDNPWSFLPPEQVELSTGGILDIDYALVEDSLPELLGQHQFGGRFGINLTDLSIQGMYYNRPSRQLDFDVTAKVEAGEEAGFINVEARPLFLREHFYGLQAESTWMRKLKIKNGFYGLVQQQNEASEAKFQTSRYDYFFISTSLTYDFSSFSFRLKHLMTNKKQIEQDGVTYFENARFLFENAVAFEVSKLKFYRTSIDLGSVYSYKDKVIQAFASMSQNFSKRLSLYARVNVIHDFEEGEESKDGVALTPTGMSRYAALDNFRIGAVYVF